MKTKYKIFSVCITMCLLVPAAGYADLVEDEEDEEEVLKPSPRPSPVQTKTPQQTASPKPLPKSGSDKPIRSVPISEPKTGSTGVLAPGKKISDPKPKEKRGPITWESDGIRGLKEQGEIELLQNVRVSQDDMDLQADKAKVYFNAATNDVKKVEAVENVKFEKVDETTGEKIKAYGNKVTYYEDNRKILLEGNARLWRGKNLIKGASIIYEMDTGWIRANRVKGEIHQIDEGKK